MHRLLIMNIDGTIIDASGRLQKSVKQAVKYVQNKGVKVTLFTSRNFLFAKEIAKTIHVQNEIITHHGTFIAEDKDQPLFEKRIENEIAYDVVRLLDSFECQITLVDESRAISNRKKIDKEFLGRVIIAPKNQSLYHYQFMNNISEAIWRKQIHPLHIKAEFINEQEGRTAMDILKGMFYEVDMMVEGNQLIIIPNGVTKLSGILFLCDYWQIPLEETVVIGSGNDDLEAIEAAGLGVAMGNAPEEVKRKADWVTRKDREDGVWYFVYEHFRKQQPIEFLEKISEYKNDPVK